MAKIVIELPEHEELSRVALSVLRVPRRLVAEWRRTCAEVARPILRRLAGAAVTLSHTRRADGCPFLCHLLLELSPAVAGDRTTYAEVFERRWEDELAAGPGRTSEVLPRGVSDS